jgi:hypothetical protein
MSDTHPSFHDGYVTGIQLSEGRAIVALERINGDLWQMTASGVTALQLDDFRQGNIISHVGVLCGVSPGRQALERLFPGPHPNAAQEYHEVHSKLLLEWAAVVEARDATVVEISPSYGADLILLCTSVRFECLEGNGS